MTTSTYQGAKLARSPKTLSRLNSNRGGEPGQRITTKAMGMAACQGLCITYNLHSKKFCK